MAEPGAITITISAAAAAGVLGSIGVGMIKKFFNGRNGKAVLPEKCALHDGIEKKIDALTLKFDGSIPALHEKINNTNITLARIEGSLTTKANEPR